MPRESVSSSDEWLLMPLSSFEARDLLEIVEARHKRASTIFISQFAPQCWHSKIDEDTLADAILDRIVHDSILNRREKFHAQEKGYPGLII